MGYIGGQALIEGVMMKGDHYVATAIYGPDLGSSSPSNQTLIVEKHPFQSLTERFWFLKIPVLRGFIALVEMMILGMKTLMYSVNVSEPEDKQVSKNEMTGSLLLSLAVSVILFVVIPASFFNFLRTHYGGLNIVVLNACEGLFRMSLFLGFIASTQLMKDMLSVYAYHGAEHKVVNAYEAGAPLTVEGVKPYSRIHLRCGTTFIMVVLLVSIIVFSLIGRQDLLHRIAFKLLLFPVISGISYEFIRLAAKFSTNPLAKILLFPGKLVQRMTTREPGEKELNAAIAAIKEVI
ncbi:MAG: DUF1385 domain-containing protein [Candidatus Margulisiibacteriota bacterium]